MQSLKTSFGYLLALDRGEELVSCLIAFARHEDLDAAWVSGIGAVDHLELGYYDVAHGRYRRRVLDEPLEACALGGNLTLLDGEPLPHLHGVFGREDFSTVGGHVFAAVCSVSLELAIHRVPAPVTRTPAASGEFSLMNLEERA